MNNYQNKFPLHTTLKSLYPWMIVACGMLFYCYNYFLRVSPSVMQDELRQAFHITSAQFGTLAGLYYIAYTPMQLPAGIIYDKFGARYVLFIAMLVVIMGLGVFVSADHYLSAGIGRFLIGLGAAFAYIGTLKLASVWLPTNRFATVAGATTAIGMISGAFAQTHLTQIISNIGYKQALHSAFIAGIFLSILIVLLVKSKPASSDSNREMQAPLNYSQFVDAICHILTNKQMWLIGIIGCLLYLPSSVFLDLWGIPYLKSVYHLTSEQAATLSTYTFYGWIISGPLIGIFSDKIKKRCMPLTVTGFFAAVLLCIVFYLPGLTLSSLYSIFFLIGFCCGGHPLCFALGKENNPANISGTSIAVTNMLIMMGGAIFQPIVGKLLDLHTNLPPGVNGLSVHTSSDYTFALSIIPIGVTLGIFLSFFLKETHCQSPVEEKTQRTNIENELAFEES